MIRGKKPNRDLSEFDLFGSLLLVGGSTSILVGVSWGGIQFPWTNLAVLVPTAAGLAALGVFCLWDVYHSRHPLMSHVLSKDKSLLAASTAAFSQGLLVLSVPFDIENTLTATVILCALLSDVLFFRTPL